MDIVQLQKFMAEKLPLTDRMNAQLKVWGLDRTEIFVPLEGNTNPKGTAFGGSLSSALYLSCWAWLVAILNDAQLRSEIVIQTSHCEFLKPVQTDFKAICDGTSIKEQKAFLSALTRKGRARIELRAYVEAQDGRAVSFSGQFVALKSP
jgi:thioesterase domain-containing protein